MLTDITILIAGAFIGWSVPQPKWAAQVSAWLEAKAATALGRIR